MDGGGKVRHRASGEALSIRPTAYAQKVKLGSGLDKLWVYFRHRGRVTNRIFKTFAPLLAFDKMDPELKDIRQREKTKAEA